MTLNASTVLLVYHAAAPCRLQSVRRRSWAWRRATPDGKRAEAEHYGADVLSGLGSYGIIRDGALFVMMLYAATRKRPPPHPICTPDGAARRRPGLCVSPAADEMTPLHPFRRR